MASRRMLGTVISVLLMAGVLLLGALLAGCTHNLTTLDGGVMGRTTDASFATMDAMGDQQAAYHGLAPMLAKTDPNGTWATAPGPHNLLTWANKNQQAYWMSPNDVKVAKLTYIPATGELTIEGLETRLTEPLAEHVAAVTIALPVLRDMTEIEARATVEKWEKAGEIAPTVADLLVQIIAMW